MGSHLLLTYISIYKPVYFSLLLLKMEGMGIRPPVDDG